MTSRNIYEANLLNSLYFILCMLIGVNGVRLVDEAYLILLWGNQESCTVHMGNSFYKSNQRQMCFEVPENVVFT